MPKESAGLLLYRYDEDGLRLLLGHMGGPQYAIRNIGTWTVPKGGPEAGESLLDAALREFEEEVGVRPIGRPFPLTSIVQRSGKRVHVWAMEGNMNVESLSSNTYELEWPPNSGMYEHHPELDRIAWLTVQEACHLAIAGQAHLFSELERFLG